jgi:hypothetical protein
MSNEAPKSTITITCWGCNKSINKPYTDPDTCQKQLEKLLAEGWVRRYFSPTAWSWFCGHVCAYHSFHAQQAEQWWKEHSKKTIPWNFILPATLLLVSSGWALVHLFLR